MKKVSLILLALISFNLSAQLKPDLQEPKEKSNDSKFRLSFPAIILLNIGEGGSRTNTQHLELHAKYEYDSKNIFGIKLATWRLFQPMGIQFWDGVYDKISSQTEFYPGYLRESGIGVTYQRMLWEGLFASVEILPLYKSYLDLNNNEIANGFKLYTSYHLGYHFSFGSNNQFFIEPQFHINTWMFDTNTPDNFKRLDNKWDKYFLFEPNIYVGIKL